ncbi:glycoside hydrolase family 3 protein [soil metagenome]
MILAALLMFAAPAAGGSAAEVRAAGIVRRMTTPEKLQLVHGDFPLLMKDRPTDVQISAGYVRGVPRLGIPDLRESDASLGVANARRGKNDDANAMPSGLALAATFDPNIAYEGGAMIGRQTRQKGFNALLAGGANLVREPRNGRNFEYLGEDVLLTGRMAGASIRGIQSNRIVATTKHFALNAQETGRHVLDAVIDPGALRESDLLAFQIAIEEGRPASVMCAYNKVNGAYACENGPLFAALKHDWGYRGWIMSDWGAVHSTTAAITAGLDQESGQQLDKTVFFGAPLEAALKTGEVSTARLDDMVTRIVYGMASTGLLDHPSAPGGLDTAADAATAQRAAEAGIVLLKNEGVLPLAGSAKRIAVIGGHADVGVLSGGGSSQVEPTGSVSFPAPKGSPAWGGGQVYHPSSPLAAIRARAGAANVSFDAGTDPASAAQAAKGADVAIVFATQWTTEGADASLTLPDGQDALIAAVTAANPHTIVVLETGGPVFTPWLDKTAAVLEAWYPGQRGGEAIARVLFGEVDAAGRLPVSFPASEAQLPRPKLDGEGSPPEAFGAATPAGFTVRYDEGADVGYRWYEKTHTAPRFPFGFGLSYARFRYGALKVSGGAELKASFTVTNTSDRAGIDTPQVYAAGPGRTLRLIGWSRLSLKPGETRRVEVKADPRLLAVFDTEHPGWRVAGGRYRVVVAKAAGAHELAANATLAPRPLAP